MTTKPTPFAARLRQLREERGWTLAQLADKLKFAGRSTVHSWECGPTSPRRETLAKVAKLYRVALAWLITGVGVKHPRASK